VGRSHSGHHWGADPAASTGFSIVAQFSNVSFTATAAIADNDIWAVGFSNPGTSSSTPVAVHFNGTSWSVVPTPTGTQPSAFEGVAAVASNDVWAVGYQQVSSTGTAQPLIEHWDGTNWVREANAAPGVRITGIAAISASDIWAVGTGGIQNWNGTSWSLVSSLPGGGVAALSDGTVVVVSGSAIIEN
jgi:hypothetical protein